MIGRTLSHYQILEKLGEGGMGVVFKARDTNLDRSVALKILPPDKVADAERRRRFIQEAKAASALNYSGIVVIHDIGQADGVDFIAMELVCGRPLADVIPAGGLPVPVALDYAVQMGNALAKAHEAGIIHRDLKPRNLMITGDGLVKILDFGLAKLTAKHPSSAPPSDSGSASSSTGSEDTTVTPEEALESLTQEGAIFGTAAYMAPEQAEGRRVDQRADLFSLGLVIYEMLSGHQPFKRETNLATLTALLRDEAPPLESVRPGLPPALRRIVSRCLAKQPEERPASAAEVVRALTAVRQSLEAESRGSGPSVWLLGPAALSAAAGLALTAVLAAGWWLHQRGRVRWARAEAIPEIRRLMAADRGAAALELAREARRWIPEDAELRMLWPEVALSPFIETEPPGAEVSYQDLASTNGIWHYAGRTPITNAVFPRGYFRWRATRDGYGEAVGAAGSWSGRIRLMLPPAEGAPVGMVLVPKPPAGTPGVSWVRDVGGINEGFFIDRHEVTNREFKRFVDAGGYEKREFWKHEFKRDGMPQTWEQAVGQFRDVTGRPGPATWEGGGYPEKQDDFPVRGVSWYEAAAYAAFAGKSLPTVAHWYHTADLWSSPLVVPRSNFGGNGPAPVGSFPSLGAFGTYDMAGNVAEWCWNETEGGLRFILGGAWGSPSYLFGEAEAKSPWDRGPKNGFRCARYPNPLPETLTQAKVRPRRDFTKELPVGDEAFRLLRAAYAYETKELKPEIEGTDDDSPYWTKQRVSIEAAYGQDRLPVLLFLPKSAKPPYQTVVFYPGSNAYGGTYDRLAGFERVDFIIRSGRALVYPIYRGMYDRRLPTATGQRDSRDRLVNTYQDMGRAIDYVVGRPEFDRDRLAFLGISLGAWRGAQMLALEGRFKTAVLMEGGMLSFAPQFPEVDPLHFLPRVRIPVLMLNGRYDFLFPFETSQKPFFQTLGTPNADKRHVVFDSAHDVMIFRTDVMREMLTWLETYLGPIRR